MKAKLKNGSIVTGRLAEIFVSRKVAVWMPEEQPTLAKQEIEEIVANDEPVMKPIIPIKAKVSVQVKKKAGRPKVKK